MTTTILIGDVREQLRTLADNSVHCIVTSPPYWGLRDYGVDGQIGLEASPAEFIAAMVDVFEELRRVLRPDGTCWMNMGDSYSHGGGGSKNDARWPKESEHGNTTPKHMKSASGLKPKDLVMMPHRLAIALQDAGWWVRQDIVWAKSNPMPESVRDRCTKAHEYIFLLTKSEKYYYDAEAIKEEATSISPAGNKTHKYADAYASGSSEEHRTKAGLVALAGVEWERRNKRSVWTMGTQPFAEAHFATFPPELPETCIKAGCPPGGIVLDPFFGAGTTGLVAERLQRDCIGIELNPAYAEIARRRIIGDCPILADVRVVAPAPAELEAA